MVGFTRIIGSILFLLGLAQSSLAFTEQEFTEEEWAELQSQWQPIQVTPDAMGWDIFASTIAEEVCSIDEDGYDYCVEEPTYSAQIKDLNGQELTLMGYMFPLEYSEIHSYFLLGPYPMSCPFHYHVGPTQIIEVNMYTPVDFTYDPIKLKGTFRAEYNEETGIFYYLDNAKQVY